MVSMLGSLTKRGTGMAKVNFNGIMDRLMKVIGKMEKSMDMEPGIVLQVTTMKDSG